MYDKIKEIDPSSIDFSIRSKSFLSPTNRYFNKIKKEEGYIASLINSMEKEKEILNRDNITLEIEINNINELIKLIDAEYENGQKIMEEIKSVIDTTPQMGWMLDTLERKMYNLKQTSLVKRQSALAFEVICKNNKKIIENLERIKNITLDALHTAVLVAESMYHQKLVLNNIKVIENGTKDLMQSTSSTLNHIQNASVSESALGKTLKDAFNNTFELISNVSAETKTSIPESQAKIIELKKIGERYE